MSREKEKREMLKRIDSLAIGLEEHLDLIEQELFCYYLSQGEEVPKDKAQAIDDLFNASSHLNRVIEMALA